MSTDTRPDHPANRRDALRKHLSALQANGARHPQEPTQQTLPGLETAYAARLGKKGTRIRDAFDAGDAVVLGNLVLAAKIQGAHAVELQHRYQEYQAGLAKLRRASEDQAAAVQADVEILKEAYRASRQVTGAIKSMADGLAKVAKLKDELGVNHAPNRMRIVGAAELVGDLVGDDEETPAALLEGLTPAGSC